jgi:hypothetical protein
MHPAALKRGVEHRLDQAADLALGDAGATHRANQVIDGAGGDALDAGFLDHRRDP